MNFLNKLLGSQRAESLPDVHCDYLESMEGLNEIELESFTKPIAIFKHSTRCSISRMAWSQFQKAYNIPSDQMHLYHLDLLAYRDISSAIAERFGVVHQSPQLILIKDGKAIYDCSHENIDAAKLADLV